MQLVLFIIAIVLFILASIAAVPNNKYIHLGWLGAASLTGAFLVGSGLL